ncbi:MAG: polysaccharide biosynthesis protein [Eggerthellaceae bacterium]|nr:polysaccharide biosynthesis protein [Eggerthellaceae bacterium]
MLWNSFGSLFGLVCQWLITVFVVRLSSGYDAAGIYSLAVSVYGIFAPIAQYRMYTYQISDVKSENTTGEYMAFRLFTCGVALVSCVAYSLFTCGPDAWLAIILYGLYKSATLIIDVLHGCDQRHERIDFIGKSLGVQGAATLFSFLAVFIVTHSLEASLGAMTLGIVMVGVLYDYPRARRFDELTPCISLAKIWYLLKRCLSVVVAGIAVSASTTLPRQLLAFLMGNAALGIYSSVAAPVAIIQMGVSYIYNPLLGYFSQAYASRDKNAFRRLFLKVVVAMVGVGVVCSIGVLLLGEPLLVLVFGESIAEHAYLLQPLVLLAVVTGFTWFVNDLLIALRNFAAAFVGSIIALALSAICMVPFINIFGMNGVTFVCLIASVISIATMMTFLFRQLQEYWS